MQVESLYADPVVAEIHEARRRLLEAKAVNHTAATVFEFDYCKSCI